MIAGARQSPHPRINPGVAQARGERGAEQDVIETHAGVSLPRLSQVVPEGVDGLVRVSRLDRVRPALSEQPLVESARLGLQERVFKPGPRVVDVEVGGHHIVVADESDRMAVSYSAWAWARRRCIHASL